MAKQRGHLIVSTPVPVALAGELERMAAERGVSKARVLREALAAYVEQDKQSALDEQQLPLNEGSSCRQDSNGQPADGDVNA